jgi:thermitase
LGLLVVAGVTIAFAKPSVWQKVRQILTRQETPRQTDETKNTAPPPIEVKALAQDSTLLVKFKSNVKPDEINSLHQKNGGAVKTTVDSTGVQVVSPTDSRQTSELITQYKASGQVEYAEPNYIAKALLVPNDPYYGSQWNLQKVDGATAWDSARGDGATVAVIDTGVWASHPDLSGEVLTGYDFVSSDNDATDDHGHGTHVAGTIAAVTNNGVGVASIGYHGSILPIKVLNSEGYGTYADVASGIIYAADNGASIINMSLGGSSSSITLQNAVNYAIGRGVMIVAAAGNDGSDAPLYPAACDGVLAISATDSSDNLASFSNYGSNIFVGAPGVGILSTYLNNSYVSMSGTSMATPHVAGLLELAESYAAAASLTLTDAQLVADIKASSDKVGSYGYDANGWNQYFGYGRINAYKLIQVMNGLTPSTTPTPPVVAPAAAPAPAPAAAPTPALTIYRFWSSNFGKHFYTADAGEKNALIANDPNWNYEGAIGNTYSCSAGVGSSVYRFWSPTFNNAHFYTTGEDEKNNLIANDPNWNYEGVTFCTGGNTQVFRFWSSKYKSHFYTTNPAEKDALISTDPNWSYEGIAFNIS